MSLVLQILMVIFAIIVTISVFVALNQQANILDQEEQKMKTMLIRQDNMTFENYTDFVSSHCEYISAKQHISLDVCNYQLKSVYFEIYPEDNYGFQR